jgi:hypothetical protein
MPRDYDDRIARLRLRIGFRTPDPCA